MSRIALYAALVLATVLVLTLLWQFNTQVLLFFLSLAVAASFHPVVERIQQRGIRRGLAIAMTFGTILLVIAGLILLAGKPLVDNLQNATDAALLGYDHLKENWQADTSPIWSAVGRQMPPSLTLYTTLTGEESSLVWGRLFGAAKGTFNFVANLALVLVLSLYWSLDNIYFERLWLSVLPVETRARARSIWLRVQYEAGSYLRREVTLSLLAGLLLWIGYLLLGVNYAVMLAFLAALARLIPYLGPLLVVVMPLLVGSSAGPWAAPLAAAYALVLLILLEGLLARRIFHHRRYSPLLVVIFMISLADAYGLPGAIFAPLLAIMVQIMFSEILAVRGTVPQPVPEQTLDQIRARMEKIRGLAVTPEGENGRESTSLVERLEELVEKTISVVGGR